MPVSSFGIGIGRGESGYAREKAQDASSSRIRAYRRDTADCFPGLCRAAGAPKAGMLSFNWATQPFVDKSVAQEWLLRLYQAGVITLDELREGLGYAPISITQESNTDDAGGE